MIRKRDIYAISGILNKIMLYITLYTIIFTILLNINIKNSLVKFTTNINSRQNAAVFHYQLMG